MYAQGYINCRYSVGSTAGEKSFAKDANLREKYDNEVWYLGTQGRYYLTAYSDDGDTLDFVHTFNIAGAQFIAAYLQKGRKADGVRDLWAKYKNEPKDKEYGADFAAGDKIKLMTWGGVSGFPEKGAKVRFAVSNPHLEPITDDILDQIKVVPNPYVISHQGQKSAYDAKLYFTKLPKECTINIYTASGDLVTTIEHKENVDDITKGGVDIFDLLTKNGQRIQSQTLVALIKTPNGAMITKQFSIIVGGFRIVD
ncbi:hypothetical protein SDC9_117416 [bioreactor metagenome]|uniref:Uncharacterized protein n=1 Tax=bioreactor metagenome TaxID=1076179 RepID=A0A645C0K4_9ZZZZ